MASLFNKIWSGLDFWDKDENRQQRERFAREEREEEERKRRRAVQRRSSGPQPGDIIRPTPQPSFTQQFDFSSPLEKVGSQSDFSRQNEQKSAPQKADKEPAREKSRPDLRTTPDFVNPVTKGSSDSKFSPKTQLQKLENKTEKTDPEDRSGLTKAATATSLSIPRLGAGILQGASGFYDLVTPGEGRNRFTKQMTDTAKGLDQIAKEKDVNTAYRTLNVPLEIASYFTPGVATRLPKVSRAMSKLPGVGRKVANFLGRNNTRTGRFGADVAEEVFSPDNVRNEVRLTNRYLGQDVANEKEITPERVAADVALGVFGAALVPGGRRVINSMNAPSGTLSKADDAAEQIDTFDVRPEADALPGTERVSTVDGEPAIEIEPGIKSTNQAKNIPDPTDNFALAKATDEAAPIADFRSPEDGSQLQKDPSQLETPSLDQPLAKADETIDEVAAGAPTEAADDLQGRTPEDAAYPVDADGNPILLESDKQRAQELAEDGMAPDRGDSVVGRVEDERAAAAEQAAREEVTGSPASMRERQAFAATEEDEVLAQEIIDSVPRRRRIDTEESLAVARENARSQSSEELISSWSREQDIMQDNPQDWINALEERKVLNALVAEGVPGAREARLNIADAMSRFQSRSGQNLNILKVAYDEMPADMKAELLIKKINRERKRAGLDDLPDQEMSELLARVEVADAATQRVKAIEGEIADFNRSITEGSATPEARQRLEELKTQRDEALADLYEKNAAVTDYFSQASPDSTFGQKLANWNRVSMLSSVAGRLFDMVSTAGTATLDTINRGLSSVIARGLNGRVGDTAAKTAAPKIGPSLDDLNRARQRTVDSARGNNQVRDVMAEIRGTNTGRSELQNQSQGRFRNMVKAGTEAPTEATRYIEEDEIYRAGRREADELGLTGEDAELYAESYGAVASAADKYAAQQEHLKTNMLHNNVVSNKIDVVSNALINSNSDIGKTTGAIMKSIVAPFTRFIGGMTHRTFTDMNVIHNVWGIRKALKNGDTQLLSDSLAKLTTNTSLGIATAAVLADTGVLTDKDANGNSYAGLYFHVGDRYIPVAFAGLASVPIIMGYGINQAADAESPADAFTAVTTDTLSRTVASTGSGGFFGADNALQTAISGSPGYMSPSETGTDERNWANLIGATTRQSIPALTNDINSILNQVPSFNPTGEKADTTVLNEDGTQNPAATQLTKIQNTIPGASQLLPREDGVPARDFLDRTTKGTRETDEMANQRRTEESLDEWAERLENEEIPVTAEKIDDLAKVGDFDRAVEGAKYRIAELEADEDASVASKRNAQESLENYEFGREHGYIPSSNEAVETRAENGEYDAALAGWELRLKRDEEEGNTPRSKLESQRRKIQRYEVFRDNEVDPGLVQAYEHTDSDIGGVGVTAWRDMMESGDPELVAYAEQLYNIDQALLEAGAIKEPKYDWGSGGRGGRGSSPRFATDIATQSAQGYNFTPIKAQSAEFSQPQTSIPQLEKVPNYSRSPKKISVKKGRL